MTAHAAVIPCLQRYARLSASVFASPDDAETQAALSPLLQYLSLQSCNTSEVEALEQWCRKQGNEERLKKCGGEVTAVVKRRVTQRARVLSEAVANRQDMLVTDARSTGVPAVVCSAGAHDSGRSGTATLVQWWHLSDDDPWNFTASASCSQATRGWSDGYRFVCLKEALTLVGPYLDLMRQAAATGDWESVSRLFIEATSYVNRVSFRDDPAAIFGSLELSRLHLALTFASRGGVASVEKALQQVRVNDDMRRAAALLDGLGARERGTAELHSPPNASAASVSKVQAYWRLILSYSTFFNTVAAYVDGSLGRFESCAKALLGDGTETGACLWGAARYPNIHFCLPHSTSRVRQPDAQPGGPKTQSGACTVMPVLFPYSSSHVRASASDHYLDEFAPLVTRVIAPASSFSTLVVLSAVGTLPLHVALTQLRTCVELREVYEGCSELTSLLDALWRGQLGVAWRCAKEAAARYLNREPHVQDSVAKKLLQYVRRSVCFHYLRVRRTALISDAAVDLGFESSEEVVETATALISCNYIDARIDLVKGAICSNELDERSEVMMEVKAEATALAKLSFSALKVRLACLSAERNLIAFPGDG
ncbi:conserved hypothetical protein [Leishmania infantum JPCM5]|uniref:Uncharacterized protein n=2 Tax=Leishmania infantum TaxID=5671 RepID=A4I9H8_LEIIN|nr:conserved hypothetical protein [Leishmania infantum JPCM5]CAC9535682.1 hypothetical_protein_-_conserved [Leishmania infantum]CAM71481.1 conserved hypothetical protein [Leishmania infantum JPCM5]SUZ45370.1 hypothetical_protein_-_conserved [Leishmania infantum]|eukprot:XP_001468397.1 conserved hypothetical protein [Leishmania infantum JPCM5]